MLAPVAFGEGDAMLDGFPGKLRAIGRDKDFPVHCFLFARACAETIKRVLTLAEQD